MSAPTIEYKREPHAAHYAGMPGKGHDLEWWTVTSPTLAEATAALRSLGIETKGAEYHCGSLDKGVQRWHFSRVAPLSEGTCARCPSMSIAILPRKRS